MTSEWTDQGWAADVNGIEADVWSTDGGATWEWSVKPSSQRCEWPEVVAVGVCKSADLAKSKAARKALAADASYPVVSYG
jgi:hypothetical protein